MAENKTVDPKEDMDKEEESSATKEETQAEPEKQAPGLEEQLKAAQKKADESQDRLLRATAEFDNYKKRAARDMTEFRKFANESLIKDLLPVLDNLERAITSSTDNEESESSVVQGVDMVLTETMKILEKFNVKQINDEGKPFDPNFHQAVMQEETKDHPEGTVLKVLQKGYTLHDRLVRPAMVVVSKAAS